MSAHVLLKLLKSCGKEIKCEACIKFNNTRARTLDSYYHMTLKGTATLM